MNYIKTKLIHNTIFSGISRVGLILIQIIIIPVIITNVGVEAFGLLSLLKVFTATGYLGFFDFGLEVILTKLIAEEEARDNQNRLNQYFNSSLFFLTGTSILVPACIIPFLENIVGLINISQNKTEFILLSRLAILSTSFSFLSIPFSSLLSGKQRIEVLKGIELIVAIVVNSLVLYLSLMNHNFITIGCAFLSGPIIKFSLAWIASIKFCTLSISLQHLSKRAFYQIFRILKPVTFSKLNAIIANETDRVLIGLHFSPKIIAYYEIVQRAPKALKLITDIISSAIMPASSYLFSLNKTKNISLIYKIAYKLKLIIIYPLMLFLTLFSSDILNLWLSKDYSHLSSLFSAFLVIGVWYLPSNLGWTILFGMNKGIILSAQIGTIRTIIKVITLIFLVRDYQLWGILFSLILPQLSIFYAVNFFEKELKLKQFSTWYDHAKIIIISIPSILMSYFFKEMLPDVHPVLNLSISIIVCYLFIYNYFIDNNIRQLISDTSKVLLRKLSTMENKR